MAAPLIAAFKGAAGPDVLAFAGPLSRASGRPLVVVTVYPGHVPIGIGRVDTEWVAYNREEAESLLTDARSLLGDDGPPAQFRAVAADSASHGLHDLLESSGEGAIVVIGSRKSRGTRRTAPGSTAERLLQGAPGSVLIVPWEYAASAASPPTRIAVAYVDTPDGIAALGAARALADETDAALELVSVLPDTLVRPSLGEQAGFAAEQRAQFERAVVSAAASVNGSARLVEGPVVDALSDLQATDVDLLVVGSRGYGPARRVLLGGVSSKVLNSARVPVMVVPRG
ncbi:universal stress protein [Glaciibacter flavus]|uniref:Universal stress protein n=1 Tax=Orlajensenia flava TaxID=2565934 RepID=A0A4S4FVH9_9MICO|nr:universal stress protein [Glaciibacter flavus]THG34371.1 universal stress protein [Glaciibacter flavus]